MKVLMQGKVDLFELGGGDKVQTENTAKELQKLGVEVEVIPGFDVDYTKYDLVHLFQLDWTPETFMYARNVMKAGKPIVLSPIHHSLQEVEKFDNLYAFDFRRLSKLLFKDQFKRDTLKNVYRSFFDLRKLKPTFISVTLGLENIQKMTLEMAEKVLVQTELEAKDLVDTYGIDINWEVVPNGVGDQFISFGHTLEKNGEAANPVGKQDYIVCIGRIEARKNQLSIIDAVDIFRKKHNQDVSLVFVGRKSKYNHIEYVHKFVKKVKNTPWITHIEEIPYEKMPAVYKFAKVCVSASWFETTGLTNLEALFCGTNAVASSPRAKEILGDLVSYCQPEDIDSISGAIAKEYFSDRPDISNRRWGC